MVALVKHLISRIFRFPDRYANARRDDIEILRLEGRRFYFAFMGIRGIVLRNFRGQLRGMVAQFYRAARRSGDFQAQRDGDIYRYFARGVAYGFRGLLDRFVSLCNYVMCIFQCGTLDQSVARRTNVNAYDRRFTYDTYRAYDQTMDFRATLTSTAASASIAAGGRIARFTYGAIVAMGRLSISGSAAASAYSRDGRSGVFRATNNSMDRFTRYNDVDVIYRNDQCARTFFRREDRQRCAFPERIEDGFGNSNVVIPVEDTGTSALCFVRPTVYSGRQRGVFTCFVYVFFCYEVCLDFRYATYCGDSTHIGGSGSDIYSTGIGARRVKLLRT